MSTPEQWARFLDPDEQDPTLDAEDRALLERARGTLADTDTWDGPPPQLEQRIVALAADTGQDRAGAGLPAEVTVDVPDEVVGDGGAVAPVLPLPRARRARLRWFAVAALAAAAVATAIVLVVSPQPEVEVYALSGTDRASQAAAQVQVESLSAGEAITLEITGLPPAPEGSYYAGWLTGPRGTAPVGSFHWRKGGIPIKLWSGVDTEAYTELIVTLQREGAPPGPSDQVFMTGSLRPAGP